MTVRTLVLLRHAKAKQPTGESDANRALTARGHADSAAAGAWLRAQGWQPGRVLCSPSRRTRETWQGIRVALGPAAAETAVVLEPALYDGDAREILEVIRRTDADVDILLVIGHNPTISTLSAALDSGDGPDEGLRTAGLAVHEVDGAWTDCAPGQTPLQAVHTARAAA
jgi:phosphohistidine phosphatase